jgi:hypothetical protein
LPKHGQVGASGSITIWLAGDNRNSCRDTAEGESRYIQSCPDAYVRSRRERKKIEMLFAQLKRILRFDRSG